MTDIKVAVSDAISSFNEEAIGSKVTIPQQDFIEKFVVPAIKAYDWSTCREPGQGFLVITNNDAKGVVLPGDGSVEGRKPEDYVVRDHRGEIGLFLKREFAAPKTSFLALVVYTRDAFGVDPQVTDERFDKIEDDATHVIVAVLASGGPAGMSSHRFVRNLAGGNNEYDVIARANEAVQKWRRENANVQYLDSKGSFIKKVEHLEREVKELVQKAKSVVEYEQSWSVVAD
jgi:hypothetical protein